MTDGSAGPDLKEIFRRAAEIAEVVPEPLREAAFRRALDELLPNSGAPTAAQVVGDRSSRAAPGTTHAKSESEGSSTDVVGHLLNSLNRSELADLMKGRKVLDRSLLVLRAAQHHEIESMTAAQIAQVLTRKFREPTTPNAVRMALERSPSFTDTAQKDGVITYALMAPGERYLDTPTRSSTSLPGTRRTSKTKTRARSQAGDIPTADPPKSSSRSDKKTSRPPAGRPGPKQILEQLLNEGYFDKPQTIGSLIDYIERKRGHRYKSTDFGSTLARLLRENKLDRDRNPDGQYEYVRRSSGT